MSDLISRSAAIESLDQHSYENGSDYAKTAELLNDLPAVDAVPVVRCKDCVHSAKLEGYASRKFEIGLNCNAFRGDNGYGIANLSLTVPDGYCDDGLRRSGVHD